MKMKLLNTFVCLFLLLACFISVSEAVHRNLSYSLNPGCDLNVCKSGGENHTHLNVVVVQATGENDVIYYLWSTYRVPTVIVAQTSLSANLHIKWKNLLNFERKAITFSEKPLHSVSFIINELWEFDDSKDTANLTPDITSIGIADLYWNDINESLTFSDVFISAHPSASNNGSTFSRNGVLEIQFSISAKEVPSNEYPHLWFTSASSEMKLLLTGLHTATDSSRFAAELIGVSSAPVSTDWARDEYVSFDDEYSPGVFKVENLHSHCNNISANCEGFISWKPVSYIGGKPTVANSSDATATNYTYNSSDIFNSIASSYFDSSVSTVKWYVTFGTSGDGFYEKTRYTAWSVMVGIGQPIMDKMSVLAIVVIAVGLGAPLLIMVGGAFFFAYKKCSQKDDDLMLEG